jgi:hypothetical protein
MGKPVLICRYETQFVTAKDKIYVKQMGEDDSEGPHVEL